MPQAFQVTQTAHPRGEPGSRRSLNTVAERIKIDRLDPEVFKWASKALFDAGNPQGPHERATAILNAIRKELIWIPDALDAERIVRAGLLVGKDKQFWGEDCDGMSIATGAACASVGISVLVVGVGYPDPKTKKYDGEVTHVLLAIFAKDKDPAKSRWLFVEPSRRNYPVGTFDKMARERVIEPLTGDVVCDGAVCLADGGMSRVPELISYRRKQGDFIGISGPPELPDDVEIDLDSAIHIVRTGARP